MADKQKYPSIPPMQAELRGRLKALAAQRGQLFIVAYRDALEAGIQEMLPDVYPEQPGGGSE